MESWFTEISGYQDWKIIRPLNDGWSDDKKYYIETKQNQKLLLRVSDFKKNKSKQIEFNILKDLNKLSINTSKPLSMGISDNKQFVYIIYTWVDGNNAEEEIQYKTSKEQYELGYKAGEILKIIHKKLQSNNDIN